MAISTGHRPSAVDTQADQGIRTSTAQATARRAILKDLHAHICCIHHWILGWNFGDVRFAHCPRSKRLQRKLQSRPGMRLRTNPPQL
jgi:hypothetical protein